MWTNGGELVSILNRMSTVKQALCPLITVSQCLGIITFSSTKSSYVGSNYKKMILVLIMLIYSASAMYCGSNFFNKARSLIEFTSLVEFAFGCFQVLTIWGSSILYQETHMALIKKIAEVDKCMQKLGVWIFYNDLRKYVWKRLFAHLTIVISIICLQLYNERNMLKWEMLYFYIIYYIPIIISFGIVENIGVLTDIVKDRFGILNSQLEELRKENELKKLETLRTICPNHFEITQIAKQISKCFGFTLLLTFSVNFINIMIGSYIICVAFQYLDRDIILNVVPKTILGIITYITNTYYLCFCGQSVVRECYKSGLLLHAIEFEDIRIKDQIQMFSMQIVNEALEFSAAGFFTVNYGLLFSIIGGLTTYIIILIQFSTNSGESIKRYYAEA